MLYTLSPLSVDGLCYFIIYLSLNWRDWLNTDVSVSLSEGSLFDMVPFRRYDNLTEKAKQWLWRMVIDLLNDTTVYMKRI